jgi:hypothetical protein
MLPIEVMGVRKHTFTFPFEKWLNQELSEVVAERLHGLADEMTHLINPVSAKQVWLDFKSGRTNWARPWALYVLDSWMRYNA